MNTPPTLKCDRLLSILEDFRARCNDSQAVRKLIKRWDRIIEIQTLEETQTSYFLRANSGVVDALTIEELGVPEMTVAASEDILRQVFCGAVNPARAHLDGELQVYGSQKDQLVLDSVVLLIWGF